MQKEKKLYIAGFFGILALITAIIFLSNKEQSLISYTKSQLANAESAFLPSKDMEGNVLYNGNVDHIFFHSLIVYPELALNGNVNSELYKKYMITRDEFEKILIQLYQNNYVLVDITSLYKVDKDGTVIKQPLYLPAGKKPLIISLDDLSYYYSMAGHGFADKLVLDNNGNVATEIVTPQGKTEVTRDGDVVPILDNFVSAHPDFSFKGAKGLIALTGYEGVLGYHNDATSAVAVINKLKATGWRFASHSYSHETSFTTGTISLDELKKDTELWNKDVRPLVGDTDIFVGPFGQIFSQNDPRRSYLVSAGFKVLCGVGMDQYFHYFSNVLVMNRADIDGYRIAHSPDLLEKYFDPKTLN